ncbi:MAG: DUF1080 domain-containing protein [Chloroflexales bacterium]|nr:DUF1080 domain-containing protein [Chloroflexales bacterium]
MSTTRICPSCGAEASPAERFCANCGTRLPEQAAVPPTVLIGQPPGTPPAGQGALHLPSDTPFAPQPPARRGLPLWAIILLALAGLCAISCVAGFVLLNFLGQQAIEQVATAAVEVRSTVEARPTPADSPVDIAPTRDIVLALPTKGPASGGGGVVGGAATGAASQVQTAQAATAVAAAGAEADAILASATQVFRDEFVDNRNTWFTGEVSEIETDKIEDGVFKVIWSGRGSTYEEYQLRDFTNFVAELDCKAQQGGVDAGCGIVFGEETDVGYYKFNVYEDYYSLFVVPSDDAAPALLEGDPSDIVNVGDWNRLRVVKQGDQISIYLNDVPLGSVSDSTYTSGKIGVATSSYTEEGGVEVWFDNFTLWELP